MIKRCRVLVEGQTEEAFVNQVLAAHLVGQVGFAQVTPIVLTTSRSAAGYKKRGGGVSWPRLENELRLLLRDRTALVTTMLDFYGLPSNVPGYPVAAHGQDPRRDVAQIEAAIGSHVGLTNLIPHITLHEFEALIYSDPSVVQAHLAVAGLANKMELDLQQCGEPELIDDGHQTAPSKRLIRHCPTYRKVADGPVLTTRIGLATIRERCPHFSQWLAALEHWEP